MKRKRSTDVYSDSMLFTTSWDDGYKLDLRVAELLERYGATGTFYVCPRKQHDAQMLSREEIVELSARHEIGAHTLRHPRLTALPPLEAMQEIEDSKAWVEDITGTECRMFCYPYGDYNPAIQELVRKAGFMGARTVEQLRFNAEDPFALPTTLHVTPFPRRKSWSRWWHPLDPFGPLRVRYKRLRELKVRTGCLRSWSDLAACLFEYASALPSSSHFHLWGHSREIEKYGMWEEFERFLQYVANTGGVEYGKNSELPVVRANPVVGSSL